MLLAAYLAGASTALSFAPYSLWLIYPFALAFAIWQSPTAAKAAFKFWLSFGFGIFSVGISWVHVSMSSYGGMPLVIAIALTSLLALYLAIYPAIAGLCLQVLAPKPSLWRNLAVFPALWILTEWLRGWVLTGFPWLWAGYSQTDGPLRPLAASIGTLGISFVLALLAGALALCFQKRWKPLVISLPILLLLIYLSSIFVGITPNGKNVNVTLVQGNIPQHMKWEPEALWPTLSKYMDLSRPVMGDNIIVWPEAAIPTPEYMVADFVENADKAAEFKNSAIITGIITYRHGEYYNSLVTLGRRDPSLISKHTYDVRTNKPIYKRASYDKHHLLPIGEFVPFESLLRPIAPFFNLPQSSFSRGDYLQKNLNVLGYKISPAICYEIAFPEQVRTNTHSDTDMLLTVSNDAWFGKSNGPLQHMEIARMRAAEMGRPLLRSTNNGVTAIVDPFGGITKEIPQFKAAVLSDKVQLVSGVTPFKRFGEWPVLVISILIVIGSLVRKKPIKSYFQ